MNFSRDPLRIGRDPPAQGAAAASTSTSTPAAASETAFRRARTHRKPPANDDRQGGTRTQTVCAVCQVVSDNHHVHYGALTCFSCRAFFRRAHAKGHSEGPNYVCKKEGRCDIADKNRKKCQSCRYHQCLTAGMNPKQVLNAEQKKVRFRKMLEKKGSMTFTRKKRQQPKDVVSSGGTSKNSSEEDQLEEDGEEDDEEEENDENDEDSEEMGNQCRRSSLNRCLSTDGFPQRRRSESESDDHVIPRKRCHSYGSEADQAKLEPLPSTSDGAHCQNAHLGAGIFSSAEDLQQHGNQQSTLVVDENLIKQEILSEIGLWNDDHHEAELLHGDLFGESGCSSSADNFQTLKTLLDFEIEASSSSSQPMTSSGASSSAPDRKVSFDQLYTFVSCFNSAFHGVKLNEEVRHRLISFHQNSSRMTNDDFMQIVAYKKELFYRFGLDLEIIQRLPEPEKSILLKRSAIRFIIYVMCRYVTADNGFEQLQCILPDEDLPDYLSMTSLRRVDINTFTCLAQLDDDSNANIGDKAYFAKLCQTVADLRVANYHTPFVATALLLASAEGLNSEIGVWYEALIDFLHNGQYHAMQIPRQTLLTLVQCLSQASDRYGSNQLFLRTLSVEASPAMGYTREEEAWLSLQISKFREAYDEVSLGDDLVNEFVMFTYDVPLSKRFIPTEISAFAERCRRIMKSHDEFQSLSDAEQSRIWRQNCFKAAAICSVKSEAFRTGFEQLNFCCGKTDHESFNQKFSPHIHTKIKKVLVTDWNRTSQAMDSYQMINYLQLTARLSNSLDNDLETFILLTLMAVFSTSSPLPASTTSSSTSSSLSSPATSCPALAQLEKKYSSIFRRRMMAAKANGGRCEMARIWDGLDAVDELATVFERLYVF